MILPQRLRFRHPAAPLVAPDVHDHRHSLAAPCAHHGALPERKPDIRQRICVAGTFRASDVGSSLDRMRLGADHDIGVQATLTTWISHAKLVQNVMASFGVVMGASVSKTIDSIIP